MNAEARQDTPTFTDPTDIFIWDEPLRLPHDRVIWKARGEVRGNFPGFMRVEPVVVDCEIRLTSNVLGITSKQGSFGIPSSAIQRVGLEAGGEQHGSSILSVDYVDALGQTRRLWLRIEKRRALQALLGRTGISAGFGQAGVHDLRLEQIVPGFTRMRASHATADDHHPPPERCAAVLVSLASGDHLGDLTVWDDRLELVCGDHVLSLSHRDVIGVTTTPRSPDAVDETVFLTFKDRDVLLSLRMRVLDLAENGRATAGEILSRLRSLGVRFYDDDDRIAFFDLSEAEREGTDPRPLYVFGSGDETRAPASRFAGESNGSAPVSVTRSSVGGGVDLADPNEPAELEHPVWTRSVSRGERYGALFAHVYQGFHLYQSLHERNLLTDEEFEAHRKRAVAEVRRVYQLIQIGLLRDVDLINSEEFERARRRLIDSLSILETEHDGN